MVDKRKRSRPSEVPSDPKPLPQWGHATSVAPNAFTRWLDHKGYKAAHVAPMIGISRAAVYDLRRRLYLPKLSTAQRIAALAEQLGGPPVPVESWSLQPTAEDLAHAEAAHAQAMLSRSTRRTGKRGPHGERVVLPDASVMLALAPDFDEEDDSGC